MEMKLYFMIFFPNEAKNFRERFRTKPRREQGFNKKYPGQSVVPQLAQLVWQAIISLAGRAVDIPPEGCREFGVEVLPAIAPYLDVNSKEYIQHQATRGI